MYVGREIGLIKVSMTYRRGLNGDDGPTEKRKGPDQSPCQPVLAPVDPISMSPNKGG